jgi:two-component system nitrate/nitrite response regulator NarL
MDCPGKNGSLRNDFRCSLGLVLIMNCKSLPLTQNVRVVIVDDQMIFREGIKSLMDRSGVISFAGEAGSRAEALAVVRREQPDIILLSINLGGECTLDLLPELASVAEGARILILADTRDGDLHRQAMRLGAKGLVMKDESFDVMAKAIERVNAGEVWLDRLMTAAVIEDLSRRRDARKASPEEIRIATLTDREREVIIAVAEGLKNKEVGERLFISDVTVRHHLTSIYSKLEVSDRLELIIFSYRHGLAPIPQ